MAQNRYHVPIHVPFLGPLILLDAKYEANFNGLRLFCESPVDGTKDDFALPGVRQAQLDKWIEAHGYLPNAQGQYRRENQQTCADIVGLDSLFYDDFDDAPNPAHPSLFCKLYMLDQDSKMQQIFRLVGSPDKKSVTIYAAHSGLYEPHVLEGVSLDAIIFAAERLGIPKDAHGHFCADAASAQINARFPDDLQKSFTTLARLEQVRMPPLQLMRATLSIKGSIFEREVLAVEEVDQRLLAFNIRGHIPFKVHGASLKAFSWWLRQQEGVSEDEHKRLIAPPGAKFNLPKGLIPVEMAFRQSEQGREPFVPDPAHFHKIKYTFNS